MNAKKLSQIYKLKPHIENGKYIEHNFVKERGRKSSGSIYYYLEKNKKSKFHSIDCDEYWIYNAGSDLIVYSIINNKVKITKLGISVDANPIIYFKKGTIFASKHDSNAKEGTFFTCITVPAYNEKGYRSYSLTDLKKKYKDLKDF